MTLTNWLIIALFLSILVNLLALWYIRKLLAKVLFVSQNLTDLVDLLTTYRNHLQRLFQLEMYYGDETMKFLIKHTKSLLDVLEDYSDIYKLTEPLELDEKDEESYDDEEETGPPPVDEENVFYGGSRSSNS
tara:strand:+ start:2505 stop:2900 length:396 start_codon:yes stop_codon:yes gene_type:complete